MNASTLNSFINSFREKHEKKLSKIPYGNCGVIYTWEGTTILRSWNTRVAMIDLDGWLIVNRKGVEDAIGHLSKSTARHLSAFMFEYGWVGKYENAKKCYYNDVAFNIRTRNFITLDDYFSMKRQEGYAV